MSELGLEFLGQRVRAKFIPQRTDDLRPQAAIRVGTTDVFYFGGIVEEGPYAGQRRFDTNPRWRAATWVPECDLQDIVLEPYAERNP